MTDRDVIIALGDTAALAEALDASTTSISNWKGRGIPWQMRPLVKDLAKRKRVKLPADFLTTKAL